MNRNGVAKHYGTLTAEERFRLILAAGARGDKGEQARLVGAGRRLTLCVEDHGPFALAFNELAVLTFGELLAEAADYLEALAWVTDDVRGADHSEGGGGGGAAGVGAWERSSDIASALGFMLKIKAGGWTLFCERMRVPPFALWVCLRGYARLQRALALAQHVAFSPEGLVRWLSRSRPDGQAELIDLPFNEDTTASALETFFRQRVTWLGGT
jgi:hypothetical protein